jgi:hypothetical protein
MECKSYSVIGANLEPRVQKGSRTVEYERNEVVLYV